MSLQLISVHVPKCAGTSLTRALAAAYGEQHLHLDYADRLGDPASRYNIDPDGVRAEWQQRDHSELSDKRVVHGHFNLIKYTNLPVNIPRATFLRHPVDRTISHYFYWLRLPSVQHTLHDYFLEQKLDLYAFCRLPHIRYFYTRIMFRWVCMERFDFIGRVESLNRDVAILENQLGIELTLGYENANPAGPTVNDDLRTRLAELLVEEIDFYHRWAGWLRWKIPTGKRA